MQCIEHTDNAHNINVLIIWYWHTQWIISVDPDLYLIDPQAVLKMIFQSISADVKWILSISKPTKQLRNEVVRSYWRVSYKRANFTDQKKTHGIKNRWKSYQLPIRLNGAKKKTAHGRMQRTNVFMFIKIWLKLVGKTALVLHPACESICFFSRFKLPSNAYLNLYEK